MRPAVRMEIRVTHLIHPLIWMMWMALSAYISWVAISQHVSLTLGLLVTGYGFLAYLAGATNKV